MLLMINGHKCVQDFETKMSAYVATCESLDVIPRQVNIYSPVVAHSNVDLIRS